MYAVMRFDLHRECPQLRVLRVSPDEDVATEHAYQYALELFGSNDNIDVVDATNLPLELPEFLTGFTAYQNSSVVFGVVGVVHKRKSSRSSILF